MKIQKSVNAGIPKGPAIKFAKEAVVAYKKANIENRVSISQILTEAAKAMPSP